MYGDVLASVEFQMSLLLFVALAGYLLASRINQSAVIGEILVGLVVGPSVLGLITYTDFVASIATLGAVILLFVIGLEFEIEDIFQVRYGIIALAGVIVPWIGGYWISLVFGYGTASAIFIGTALTATSIAITASILKEMGKLDTEVAKAIIGAAVIDDILGLIALSVTTEAVNGAISISSIGRLVIVAIIFVAGGVYIGRNYVSRLIVKMDESNIAAKYPEFVFIFAMMFAFFYAMCAELVGLSAIVGGFIAGVSFVGVNLKRSHNVKEGAEYLQMIFAAVFFVSLGILADIHAVTPAVLVFLIVLTIVAIVTKVVGCGIPARLTGLCTKDSLILGFGMAPRGEVAMIVALIGLNAGAIGQDIYVSLILMSLLTTLITPIIYRNWFFKGEYCTYPQHQDHDRV
jgi:Kef-type K+ transport system membrane component KefB